MSGRISIPLLTVFAALACWAPAAGADDARYEGSAADGSVVFFTTAEAPALLGDTDLKTDVYMRSYDASPGIEDFVTRKVSTGPAGGNSGFDAFFAGASEDGSRVFFSTRESLVAEDADQNASDLYMRDTVASTTTLVSVADGGCDTAECGNAALNVVSFTQRGVTPDGGRAFFITSEALVAGDDDQAADLYRRDVDAAETVLVTAGSASCAGEGCGNGAIPVLSFDDASANGNRVAFRSEEKLAAADADGGQPDIYQRDVEAGTTTLVSVAGTCPPAAGNCVPTYGGSSADGAHVIFETSDRIEPAKDTDDKQDVYDWSGGTPALVSAGASACEGEGCGNGPDPAIFPSVVSGVPGISVDGARVFFETDEQLVGADDDGAGDVYERAGGVTALVSRRDPSCEPEPAACDNSGFPAIFRWISPDDPGSAVIVGTQESLAPADSDKANDVYARAGATTTLLSTGSLDANADVPASFAGASDDGSRVFFLTAEQLAALDTDGSADIYSELEGEAELVSAGDASCAPQSCGNGEFGAGLEAVSGDGAYAFFSTDERLTSADKDGEERDVYQRSPTGTLLVSTGNSVELGPPPPTQLATDPPSPGASTSPRIQGQAEPGSSIQIYTNESCSGEPFRAGTAEQLSGAGIQVSVAAGSTTQFWLTAEAEGITSTCAGPVTYKQQGGSSPGGGSGGGSGSGGGAGSGGSAQSGSSRPDDGGTLYVMPLTRITFGPGFKTRKRRVVFRFTDATGQPDTNFICKLDRRRWHQCGSPKRLPRLDRGQHVFKVKGVNAAGVWEARPSARRFKVVRR
jgi:hypothetical protein